MEGWVYALLAVLVWGVEAIIVRGAGDGVNPLVGTGIGCIAAGLVFAIYLGVTGKFGSDILTRSGFLYGLAGVTSFAVGHYFYYTAIHKAGASLSASLVATYPLITVVMAWILFGEQITVKSGLGTLFIIIGGLLLLL
jgi:transporter family protein